MDLFDPALEWFDEHSTLVAIAGGLVSALCGVAIDKAWASWTLIWPLSGIVIGVGLPTVGTRRNRLNQGRSAANRCIRRVLHACAVAFGHPSQHVRVNIMRVVAKGQRRRVDPETAFNMDADPDSDLEINATAGVSGEAYTQRKPAAGDLTVSQPPSGPSWGLLAAERARIRPTLSSILSVPIFDPDDAEGQLLATLQIDSDLPLGTTAFDDPDNQQMAERFADAIAFLLQSAR